MIYLLNIFFLNVMLKMRIPLFTLQFNHNIETHDTKNINI